MTPAVSVIMTVYNGEAYLEPAVASLLDQSFRDFELLVIDNGCTDGSPAILRRFQDPRLKITRIEHVERTPALNVALGRAKGELVAVQDADDISMPARLERQVDYMRRYPETVLLASWYETIDETGRMRARREPPTEHGMLTETFPSGNPIAHSTVMYRRAAAEAVGGYPGQYGYAQDFGLYLRLLRHGRVAALPEVLVQLREHAQSLSATPDFLLHRAVDHLCLFEEARGLAGLSPAARRRGRRKVTEMTIEYADALWALGRKGAGIAWFARAFFRDPFLVAANEVFQNRILMWVPGLVPVMRAAKRTAKKALQ